MTFATLAAKNVLRNRFRTSLTILGVAVAILAFVLLRTVLEAWFVAVDYAAKDRLGTRNRVSFIVPLPKHYIDTVRQVDGVKVASWANWFGAKDPRDETLFFPNLAVDPKSFLEVYDDIVLSAAEKERWFQNRQGVIIGDQIAPLLNVKVGDSITLLGTIYQGDHKFTVEGIYTAKTKAIDRTQFLLHWDYLNEIAPPHRKDTIGWIATRIDDPRRSADVSAAIDKIFDEKDAQTLTMSERNLQMSFLTMVSAILRAIDIVSVVILLIMALILGNTIAMGVRERTGEYGTLRAIGFSPRHVAGFIVGEGFFTGLLGGTVGVLLAIPAVNGLGKFLEENMAQFFPYFRIQGSTVLIALTLAVGLAVVSSLVPAYQASRLSVTGALRRVG
jgi:putative ABC transport system permease protein